MHAFTIFDLLGLIAVSATLAVIFAPLARALARRLESRGSPTVPSRHAAELQELEEQLDLLQERVDFLERALASRRAPQGLEPPRNP